MGGFSPELLSPSITHRSLISSSVHNSPEFEFWRVTNRSSNQPNVNLISADELFHGGILLPLHMQNINPDPNPPSSASDLPVSLNPEHERLPGPELIKKVTASKRWSSLFRKSEKKPPEKNRKENSKREKKTGFGTGSTAAAELNINIWPFSRSRSAGNISSRHRMSSGSPTTRKISSAPCSRSNSAGELKSRKWPSSPVRGGVHLGRSSPVWQARRGDPTGKTISGRVGEKMKGKREIGEVRRGKTINEDNKPKVLNLNAPVCTGSRSRLSCRNAKSGSCSSNDTARTSANSLFGFRNLFVKKVH